MRVFSDLHNAWANSVREELTIIDAAIALYGAEEVLEKLVFAMTDEELKYVASCLYEDMNED